MWGAPGTALAASFMREWTNEERWLTIFLKKIEELWSRWKYRPEHNCFLWRQRLYRPEPRIWLGPVHGFTENACVLMRAASMMPEERRDEMYDRIARATLATAHIEYHCANWLALADSPPADAARSMAAGWGRMASPMVSRSARYDGRPFGISERSRRENGLRVHSWRRAYVPCRTSEERTETMSRYRR
jgi:hypothetical protein